MFRASRSCVLPLVLLLGLAGGCTRELPVDDAPVADAGDDLRVEVDTRVVLSAAGSRDPEGKALTFLWTALSAPRSGRPGLPRVGRDIELSFTPARPGSYVYQLLVADGENISAPDFVVVQVAPRGGLVNNPPVLAAVGELERVVDWGTEVTLNVTAEDADGDILRIEWTQLDETDATAVTLDIPLREPGQASFVAPAEDAVLRFRVTVDDSRGGIDELIFQVTVTDLNQAPIAHAGLPQTASVNAAIVLDGSASADPDAGPQPLAFRWTVASVEATDGQPGEIPAPALSGDDSALPFLTVPDRPARLTFELLVNDGRAESAPAQVVVEVQSAIDNQAPVADAGRAQEVASTFPVTLDGSGSSDPDGDALSYAWVQTEGEVVSLDDASSATPGFTAPEGSGTLTFVLLVHDGKRYGDPATTQVAVFDPAANDPPQVDAGDNQTVVATGQLTGVPVLGVCTDPEDDSLDVGWFVEEQRLASALDATLLLPKGNHRVRLRCDDGTSVSEDELRIIVLNAPPEAAFEVASISERFVDCEAAVELDASPTLNPDADSELIYSWSINGQPTPGGELLTLSLPEGRHAVTLSVSDGIESSRIEGEVVVPNAAPIADAGPDQLGLRPQGDLTPVQMDASASRDPDCDPQLSYRWVEGERSYPARLDDPRPSLQLSRGAHVITLQVSDGEATSEDTVRVVFGDNRAPIANAGVDFGVEATGPLTSVTLDGLGSVDPDDDLLTYAWRFGQSGSAVGPTPTIELARGEHEVRLTVSDGDREASDTLRVTVRNAPPTADAGPDRVFDPQCGRPETPIELDGRGSLSPDGDALIFTWLRDGEILAQGLRQPQPIVGLAPGSHLLTLRVQDQQDVAAADEDEVLITVREPAALEATLLVPAQLSVDADFEVTMRVHNAGGTTAGALELQLAPDPAMVCGGMPAPAPGGDLGPGGRQDFRFSCRVPEAAPGAALQLGGSVAATDSAGGCRIAAEAPRVDTAIIASAELSARVLTPAAVNVGTQFVATVEVCNPGGTEALAVMSDPPVARSDAGIAVTIADPRPLPRGLAVGGCAPFNWRLVADAPGALRIEASARGEDAGNGGALVSSPALSALIDVQAPAELSAEILVDTDTEVLVGGILHVEALIRNIGDAQATNIAPRLSIGSDDTGEASLLIGPSASGFVLEGNGGEQRVGWDLQVERACSLRLTVGVTGRDGNDGRTLSAATPAAQVPVRTPVSVLPQLSLTAPTAALPGDDVALQAVTQLGCEPACDAGCSASFSWAQTGGPAVVLRNADSDVAGFTACDPPGSCDAALPAVVRVDLTLSNGRQEVTDGLDVELRPFVPVGEWPTGVVPRSLVVRPTDGLLAAASSDALYLVEDDGRVIAIEALPAGDGPFELAFVENDLYVGHRGAGRVDRFFLPPPLAAQPDIDRSFDAAALGDIAGVRGLAAGGGINAPDLWLAAAEGVLAHRLQGDAFGPLRAPVGAQCPDAAGEDAFGPLLEWDDGRVYLGARQALLYADAGAADGDDWRCADLVGGTDDDITALLRGADGALWVASAAGLLRFTDFAEPLEADRVVALGATASGLAADTTGGPWVAGLGELGRIVRPGERLLRFDTAHGVGDASVHAVATWTHAQGRTVWVASDAGLDRQQSP